MLELSFNSAGVRRFEAVMAQAPRLLQPFLLDGMKRVGLEMERHVKATHLSGGSLDTRTGTLRRAVFSRTEAAGEGDAVAVVGVDLGKAPYGRIQEMGGTIRPQRASRLAIPVGEARTAKGVGRFSARDLIANPGAFGYTGAFFRKNVLFGTRGQQAVPLFALKPQVTIKATGYLRNTGSEKRVWAIDELGRWIAKGLKSLFPNG